MAPYPDEYVAAVERELELAIAAQNFPLRDSPLFPVFLNMQRYHLGWSDAEGRPVRADAGKRMRPLLCLLSAEAVGGDWHDALPAAAAIELVHNFSLIHDDIEDNSAERRGRPALWQVWGLAHGINAGDAMFSLSRLALDRLVAPAPVLAEVHHIFDRTTLAITEGQFLDLSFEQRDDVTVDNYMEMVRGKTAALLAAAARIGACIGGAKAAALEEFVQFGEKLGIAFQIADDVLGIWGHPAVTGKPAGDDLRARKKSLPVLLAADSCSGGEVRAFLNKPQIDEGDVTNMLELLAECHAQERAEALAEEYKSQALTALEETGLANPAADRLRELARSAVRRQK
ncbi:MAG: polyprenyl synthetase family protein [Rudaea sp.]